MEIDCVREVRRACPRWGPTEPNPSPGARVKADKAARVEALTHASGPVNDIPRGRCACGGHVGPESLDERPELEQLVEHLTRP